MLHGPPDLQPSALHRQDGHNLRFQIGMLHPACMIGFLHYHVGPLQGGGGVSLDHPFVRADVSRIAGMDPPWRGQGLLHGEKGLYRGDGKTDAPAPLLRRLTALGHDQSRHVSGKLHLIPGKDRLVIGKKAKAVVPRQVPGGIDRRHSGNRKAGGNIDFLDAPGGTARADAFGIHKV